MSLTQREIEALHDIDESPTHDTGLLIDDPVDLPPAWESRNKYIERSLSKRIVEYSDDHSNSKAAEYFGISERTVERHRATWNDESTDAEKIEFAGHTRVTSPMCAVMREMAHDGIPLSEIADRFDCHKRTAHLHVSATEECQHDHLVPRVHYE